MAIQEKQIRRVHLKNNEVKWLIDKIIIDL